MSDNATSLRIDLSRARRWPLVVGAVALLASAVGGAYDPAAFFPAYLAAYQFFLGVALGCFALVMVYHLTGGAWGFLTRRLLEAGMRTLPLLGLLFVPIACGPRYLFPWVQMEAEELGAKALYLNVPFFWVRAVAYFVVWIACVYFLDLWSRRQDETGDASLLPRLGLLSAAGLVLYGVSIFFASIDWLMSLQPAFRSTIIGPLYASGHLLSALALVVVALAVLLGRSPLSEYASADVLNDLGNLLLTFVVIWAYMVYFQFMLVWIADLPHEVLWFLPRSAGGWRVVVWALVILHFAVPFFLLLLRDVKRYPPALAGVAALLLVTHLTYCFYQVLPAFPNATPVGYVMAVGTTLGIGGLWLADYLWELGRRPLVARNDPGRAAALHLRQVDEAEEAEFEEVGHG
jgi:hypothetical protein